MHWQRKILACWLILGTVVTPSFLEARVYEPGETLDPSCLPSDPVCGVSAPLVQDDENAVSLTIATSSPSATDNKLYNIAGVLYWNGAAVGGASGLSSLNGDTSVVQAFTTGTTGSDFNISTAGGVHTFNLPTASATARGLVSSADYVTFSNKADSTTTVTAGTGLSGGGTLGSSFTIDLDIDGLTAVTGVDSSDTLAIYDTSVGGVRKITRADFLQGLTSALTYQGTWDAAANSPVLADNTGSVGETYVAETTAAAIDLGSGALSVSAGDLIIHNGSVWQVAPSGANVASVFGRTGSIAAESGDYTADQITNVATGTIAATDVQGALNELAEEKLTSTLENARIFIGDGANEAEAVALFGDASLANTGEITILSADVTHRGLVSTTTQTFAGAKTFTDDVTVSGTTTAGALTVLTGGIAINGNVPSDTTARLYNNGGTLYWDGSAITTTDDGVFLSLADWSATTTDALTEGSTNRYFTNARSDARFAVNLAGTTTDALAEGASNLYWTEERFNTALLATSSLPHVSVGTSTYADTAATAATSSVALALSGFDQGDYLTLTDWFATTTHANLASLPGLEIAESQITDLQNYLTLTDWNATTTDALAEGSSNLYWTQNRFDVALLSTSSLPHLAVGTSSVALGLAGFDQNDYLTLADWFSTTSAPHLTTLGNLAEVGTIATGTWQGDVIGAAYGGTGNVTYAVGDLLYADGVNSLTRLSPGTDGQVLKLTAGVPSWGTDIAGGGGGSGLWATTSDSLAIFPTDIADVVVIGGSATTSAGYAFEVIGDSLFDDVQATNATTTNVYTTTLGLNSEYFTDLTGDGLLNLNGVLTVATSTFFTLADWSATTTDALAEGSTNLYWTNDRFNAALLATSSLPHLAVGTSSVALALSGFSPGDYLTLTDWFSTTSAPHLAVSTSSVALALAGFDQSDYLTLAEWSATTTDALAEGSVNRYYATALFAADLAGTTTDALAEGLSNLYFTNARSDARFAVNLAGTTTDALAEGANNLYWTEDRFDTALLATSSLPHLSVGTSTYATLADTAATATVALALAGFNPASYLSLADWNATTTDALSEGSTNRYFTNARADERIAAATSTLRAMLSAGTGLAYSSSTGTFTNSGVLSLGGLTGAIATSSLAIALSDTTGTLPVSRGGTGITSIANNAVLIGAGSTALATTSRGDLLVGSGLSLTGGSAALLGGNATVALNINGLTEVTGVEAGDTIALYDVSASGIRQVTRANFLQGLTSALTYQGTWDANLNSPALSNGTGSAGNTYVADTATTTLDLGSGPLSINPGDMLIHNGTEWQVAPSGSNVASVFGRTGAIAASSGDYSASQVTFVATSTIAATNVQAAIEELLGEGGLTSLNGLTGSAQTFANDTNITISSAGVTHTLGWDGQLAASRGGTGLGSVTANQLLIGNSAGTGWTQLAISSLGLLTTNIAEGTNLYWTQGRFDAALLATSSLPHLTVGTSSVALALSGFNPASYLSLADWNATTTDALAEGANNLYWTQGRFDAALLGTSSLAHLSVGTSTYAAMADTAASADAATTAGTSTVALALSGFNPTSYLSLADWNATTTDALTEGSSSLYWTQGRFDAALLATSSLPHLTVGNAATSTVALALDGFDPASYLSLADWNATTTDALAEGLANLYWTDARFDARLSATTTLPNLTTLLGLTDTITTNATTTNLAASILTVSGNSTFATTTVTELLTANQGITLASSTPLLTTNTLYNQAGELFWNGSAVGGGGGLWSENGADIHFATGNVGVGTTSPTARLAVAGDIIQTPVDPVIVGGITSATTLDWVQNIVVVGSYAYTAAFVSDTFSIIDIADPTNPTTVGTITDAANLNGINGITVVGNYAYVANTLDDSLRIIDISNPTNPTIVGGIKDATDLNGIRNVEVVGNYAYVANSIDGSFRIIDIADPTNPTIIGGIKDTVNLNGITSVAIAGRYAYVVSQDASSLQIIDLYGSDFASANIGSLYAGDIASDGLLQVARSRVSAGLNVGGDALVGGLLSAGGGLTLANATPATTSNALYNQGGTLYWDGEALGGGLWSANGANIHFATGNVGIGTTTPATRFAIEDHFYFDTSVAGNEQLRIGDNPSATTFVNSWDQLVLYGGVGGTGIRLLNDDTGTGQNGGRLVLWSDETLRLWHQDDQAVVFGTNDIERMRITNTGNVGIGDTTPDLRLEVVGTSTDGYFGISSVAGNDGDVFMVDENGNVGVGTNDPAARLAIAGDVLQTPTNPTIVGGISTSTLNATYRVEVVGDYAYTFGSVSDTFVIISIADPSNPTVVGSVTSTDLNGISNVVVAGRYAYTVSTVDDSFRVIDIADPTNPTIVGGIKDPVTLENMFSLDVVGTYAYVASFNDDSVSIIDISDPTNPTIVGYVKDVTQLDGVYSLQVADGYAYAASLSADALTVVDVSNPSNPTVVGSVTSFDLNGVIDVAVAGNYVYAANFHDDSLRIIDVADPTNPTIVGGIKSATSLNTVYGVAVAGNYAYVTSFNDDSLQIIDVASSTNPVIVASVKDSVRLDGARGVDVVGRYAYVASQNANSLQIIDLHGSDFASANIGSLYAGDIASDGSLQVTEGNISSGLNVGGDALVGGLLSAGGGLSLANATPATTTNTLYNQGGTLYWDGEALGGGLWSANGSDINFMTGNVGVGTTSAAARLAVAGDILQTPINPTIVGGIASTALLDGAYRVAVVGNYAYVTGALADTLAVIDVSSPSNPTVVGSVTSAAISDISNVAVAGRYAYVVAATNNSFRVIDIADPTNPTIVGGVQDATTLANVNGVDVSGAYAYVASVNDDSLTVIDIADPTNPTIVGSVKDTVNLNGVYSLQVVGEYVYAASLNADALAVVDISDPTNPTIVGSVTSPNLDGIFDVAVAGRYAYAVNLVNNSLRVIDIADPTNPTIVGGVQSSSLTNARGVAVAGRYAYVASVNDDSLTVIDIADPTNPTIVAGVKDNT